MSKESIRDRSRNALRTVSGRERLDELRGRVAELEKEIQETRRLNRRLAELMDVVQELLLPVAQRDEELLRERLERYSASL